MSLLTAAAAAVIATACVGAVVTVPDHAARIHPATTQREAPDGAEAEPGGGAGPLSIITAAGDPYAWVRGHGRALLLYYEMPPRWWPSEEAGEQAVALVDRDAHVLRRWAPGRAAEMDWWPVGRGFVGMTQHGERGPVLLHATGVVVLTQERGYRTYRAGDTRFGEGWLLNRSDRTISKEDLPHSRCARSRWTPSALTDLRGRLWCLDSRRRSLSWTDDGRAWTRHRLAASHFEYCDGGTTGAEIAILGRRVAVGLWRADFSFDRGRTWSDVDLPVKLVGADQGAGGSFPNCTEVRPLADGRLVLSYFGVAVATGIENTEFALVDYPAGTRGAYPPLFEGVLVASQREYGRRLVSYDGGATWREFRSRALLQHLFPGD
jgi:hypothetical protein